MLFKRLADHLKQNKKDWPMVFDLPAPPIEAAVLALLIGQPGEQELVFTQRSEEVLHHKGQVCFPGGMVDPQDEHLWATAMRETEEELGIPSSEIIYVGELGKIVTPTGYRITPFVGCTQNRPAFKPNPSEIAEIFSAPIHHFLQEGECRWVARTFKDFTYEDPAFTYGKYAIWGATARILVELLEAWKKAAS